MKNNIIYVSLNDSKAESTLCQYDKGQILQFVEEVPDGVHVLLSNQKSKLADRKIIVKNQVEILDDLLEESGTLTVNVQIVDESSETTTKTIRIDVLRRKDANDDIAPENQQTFIEQVQEIMTATKSIAENVQERADNGEFNGKDGVDGKDGYTPVKGTDYFTDAEVNQIKNDTREQVVTEITPSLENNLKSAKDYTDNAIIRDFKDITYDETTATFVFTRHDDTTFTVDLPIEQTVKDGRYDDETAELVLVLVSGQEIRIPVSGLIDDYIGVDSATIQVVISADNKITCNIIGGTISKTLLTTELQEEIDGKANKSEMSNLVQEVGGKLLELATTDKESYVAAINELVTALANKADKSSVKSWKTVRTIVVPSDDYAGQAIDGVSYTTRGGTGICSFKFNDCEDGTPLVGHDITGIWVKATFTPNVNINQGFLGVCDTTQKFTSVVYGAGFKNYTSNTTKFIAVSKGSPTYNAGGNSNPYMYPYGFTGVDDVSGISFYGHESTSVLGEGSQFEIRCYGYWDD